jgi:hypothetical protein
MRKIVLILIGFIAVVTFIRAYDNSAGVDSGGMNPGLAAPAVVE